MTLRVPGFALSVAVAGAPDAPVLVLLSGGPGQPGRPFLDRARDWLGDSARDIRLVTIDQRGTGGQAIDCPALQREMGASDLTPPSRAAVTACNARVNSQRYRTEQTVGDLEALRKALKVDKLALDGVSYGTYVAQRYAIAHPDRVSALILDSVVPSGGVSLTEPVPIAATRRILGAAATADLARVIAREHDGPQMLDLLTSLSIGVPHDRGLAATLHAAAAGDMQRLDALQANVLDVTRSWGAEQLSQGLHAAALCADTPTPWAPGSPLAGRRAELEAAVDPNRLYPYDRATATGNGMARQCLYWRAGNVPPAPRAAALPDVPTLLLAGDRDLSTPLEWARQTERRAPGAKLLIDHGAGHGVQNQGDPAIMAQVRRLVASLR